MGGVKKEEGYISQRMRTCRHFTGIQNKVCAKGIEYLSVRDESVRPYAWPCTNPGSEVVCTHRSPHTREEVEEEMWAFTKRMGEVAIARAAITAATKGARGTSGEIPCPVCDEGTLHYSVAGLNGHVHASCSTDGCVRWME